MSETASRCGGELGILNKQSRTPDNRWPSRLGVGLVGNNSSP
jgi:hypothetical protein